MFDRRMMLSYLDGLITESQRQKGTRSSSGGTKDIDELKKELTGVEAELKQHGRKPMTLAGFNALKVRRNDLIKRIKG